MNILSYTFGQQHSNEKLFVNTLLLIMLVSVTPIDITDDS